MESLSSPPEGHADLHFPSEHATRPLTQFRLALWKFNLVMWRAPDYNAVRFFYTAVVGLLIGGVYFGLGSLHATQQEVCRRSILSSTTYLYAHLIHQLYESVNTCFPVSISSSLYFIHLPRTLY